MKGCSPLLEQQLFDAISTLPCTPSPLLPLFLFLLWHPPWPLLCHKVNRNGPAQQPSPASLNPSPFDKAAPCTDTFTVPQAEPCDTLVTKLGLSKADILSLNSGLSCDSNIPAGKVLCIKDPKQKSPRALAPKPQNPAPAQAPACKTHATATETTCNGLAPKFGLTPKQFVEFNTT
ncbi:hypothetical protein H4582DRAFT_214272 [Lactarius indigo]|nr:hypothetical protein H4582DRAFT_214272 [Lactarius indigo]